MELRRALEQKEETPASADQTAPVIHATADHHQHHAYDIYGDYQQRLSSSSLCLYMFSLN